MRGNDIKITLRNGDVLDFPHTGRAGGSYTKTIKYENGFAIVTDEWYKQTAVPESNIEKVEVIPH